MPPAAPYIEERENGQDGEGERVKQQADISAARRKTEKRRRRKLQLATQRSWKEAARKRTRDIRKKITLRCRERSSE